MSNRPVPPARRGLATVVSFVLGLGLLVGVHIATVALTAQSASAAVATGDVVFNPSPDELGIPNLAIRRSNGSIESLDAQYAYQPDISADGSKVVFQGQDGNGLHGLYTENSNGSGKAQLTVPAISPLSRQFSDSAPRLSPNGSKVAFRRQEQEEGGNPWRIHIINTTDGSNDTTLTSAGNELDDLPVWSPNGSRLAFDQYTGTAGVYLANATGSANIHLIYATNYTGTLNWSPDGAKLYTWGSNGDFGYLTSTDDFATANNVTFHQISASSLSNPRLSSDGSTIYYDASVESECVSLFSIPSSGGTATRLTNSDDCSWHPQWAVPVSAAYPATQPANSTVAINAPTSHDAYGVRQVTVGLSATGNMRYDLGWSTSATTAPTGNFQTITNMTTRTGPLNFMGIYSGSGTVWNGGTQPDQNWYLWVRSVKTNGTANAWGTPLLVHTPKAGLLVGVGDSYLSGHHQDGDERYCPNAADAPLYPGNIPCGIAGAPFVQPNDYAFSWLPKTALTMSSTLHLSGNWQIISKNAALSGASAQSFGDATFAPGSSSWAAPGTQADAIRAELYPRYNSWSYLAFTGGSDDTNWISVMTSWYINHFASAYGPWAVPTANGVTDCPDTQSVYATLGAGSPTLNATITSNLQGLMIIASSVSPGVRGLNVDYPYVEDNTSICYNDSGAWHGVKSVVDLLHADHAAVTGSNVKLIDLRANFGVTPVASGYLQLTRLYGYPHPSGSVTSSTPGQTRIANAVAAVATGTGW